jgi:N4-gp56 family major capsid protein
MASYSGMQYGDIPQRVGVVLVAKMLDHARPITLLEKYGTFYPTPANKGQTLKFRRPVPLDVSPVQLVEGVTPAPSAFEYDDVTVSIAQYGGWIGFTDVLAETHEDPNISTMGELLGEAAATMKEMIIWNTLRAGTNVIYSGTATARSQVTATITEDELRQAQKELKMAHGRQLTKQLNASPNVATEPVAPAFIAFGSTALEPDLRDLSGFVPREKYSNQSLLNEYEIGKFEDIRFVLSPAYQPFVGAGSTSITGVENNGTNVDVYPLVVLAKDAFGITALRGMSSVAVAVKQPKMGVDYNDPLGQRGFVAWKMWFAVVRLNETWMVRIETAASSY